MKNYWDKLSRIFPLPSEEPTSDPITSLLAAFQRYENARGSASIHEQLPFKKMRTLTLAVARKFIDKKPAEDLRLLLASRWLPRFTTGILFVSSGSGVHCQ